MTFIQVEFQVMGFFCLILFPIFRHITIKKLYDFDSLLNQPTNYEITATTIHIPFS